MEQQLAAVCSTGSAWAVPHGQVSYRAARTATANDAEPLDTGTAALRADRCSRLRVSASLTIAERLLPAWLVSFRLAAERRGNPPPEIVLTAANTDAVISHVTKGAHIVAVHHYGGPRGRAGRRGPGSHHRAGSHRRPGRLPFRPLGLGVG